MMGRKLGAELDPEIEQRLRRLALSVVADLPPDVEHAERVLNYSRELLMTFICQGAVRPRKGSDKPSYVGGRPVLSIVP